MNLLAASDNPLLPGFSDMVWGGGVIVVIALAIIAVVSVAMSVRRSNRR